MSDTHLRNITNSFQDVQLLSIASWPVATRIEGCDKGGPYVVLQEGFDPQDVKVVADEFVLGRSGKWLSLSLFFRMSVEARRAEFVFPSAAAVMKVMSDLPTTPEVIRPTSESEPADASRGEDALTAAVNRAKQFNSR